MGSIGATRMAISELVGTIRKSSTHHLFFIESVEDGYVTVFWLGNVKFERNVYPVKNILDNSDHLQ